MDTHTKLFHTSISWLIGAFCSAVQVIPLLIRHPSPFSPCLTFPFTPLSTPYHSCWSDTPSSFPTPCNVPSLYSHYFPPTLCPSISSLSSTSLTLHPFISYSHNLLPHQLIISLHFLPFQFFSFLPHIAPLPITLFFYLSFYSFSTPCHSLPCPSTLPLSWISTLCPQLHMLWRLPLPYLLKSYLEWFHVSEMEGWRKCFSCHDFVNLLPSPPRLSPHVIYLLYCSLIFLLIDMMMYKRKDDVYSDSGRDEEMYM